MIFFNILLSFISLIAGLLNYSRLPNLMPMHWNIYGQVDSYMPKNIAVWVSPLIMFGMIILFYLLPYFDPKKEKYTLFMKEWKIIQTGYIVFMAYMHGIVLTVSMYPSINMMPLFFIGLGSFFVLLGNYLSKIRQNYFIGIRVPWTLANEDNWNKTHRFASWCFVLAGILIIAEAYFFWFAPVVIFASIIFASCFPILYSFLLFQKKERYMKYVYVFLFGIICLIGMIRTLSPEDTWVCVDGTWIIHGKPSIGAPNEPCR